MPDILQENWVQLDPDARAPAARRSGRTPRQRDLDAADYTDRPLPFSAPYQRGAGAKCFRSDKVNSARERWLAKNDVHTEFVDVGIGCCWFAQQGDDEPVTGETEHEAIERLAMERGLVLWDEPDAKLSPIRVSRPRR